MALHWINGPHKGSGNTAPTNQHVTKLYDAASVSAAPYATRAVEEMDPWVRNALRMRGTFLGYNFLPMKTLVLSKAAIGPASDSGSRNNFSDWNC